MTTTAEQRRTKPKGGQEAFFASSLDGVKIRYGIWPAWGETSLGTVVVLPGRTEFIEKFYEVIFELLERGYSVAAMDWRGQGMSHRALADREKHYLEDFADVFPDLAQCMDEFIKPALAGPYTALAHSMGGHLTLRFLHDFPDYFSKAAMTAPMVDIEFGVLPSLITEGLPKLMKTLGQEDRYAPGQDGYKDGRWGWRAKLTHDMDRFEDEDFFITENRDLALGGITYGWMIAAVASIKKLNSAGYPEAIKIPTLVVQAGGDEIVRNDRMTTFLGRMPNATCVHVPDAMHEILKEEDQYRDQFWSAFDAFMAED